MEGVSTVLLGLLLMAILGIMILLDKLSEKRRQERKQNFVIDRLVERQFNHLVESGRFPRLETVRSSQGTLTTERFPHRFFVHKQVGDVIPGWDFQDHLRGDWDNPDSEASPRRHSEFLQYQVEKPLEYLEGPAFYPCTRIE